MELPARARVFLSYGRRDASELAARLRVSLADRFDVWQDTPGIEVARPWDETIEAAIRSARVVVFLLTPHSVRESRSAEDGKDSICRDELAYAREHNVPILPARVMPCDTPLLVHRLQQLDLQRWNESQAAYDASLERIKQSLDSVLAGQPVPERQWHDLPTPYQFEPLIQQKLKGFTGRQWLLKKVDDWVSRGGGSALLIVGDPGSGKSAVAAALVRNNSEGRVLAYHFCDFYTPDTTNPAVFVRSVAAQLSACLPAYESMLDDPEVRRALAKANEDPASAFELIVLGLLWKLKPPSEGPRYILVDALDEALSRARPTIVDVLASRLDRLPPWLKIVATTRRDPPVLDRLRGLRAFSVDAQGHENREDHYHDIAAFIDNRLREPAIECQLAAALPERQAFAGRLLEASEGNFLAVSTALEALSLKLITPEEAEGLSPLLESRYRLFFERMFPDPAVDYTNARRLLEVVVASGEPLLRQELASVLAFQDDHQLAALLRQLNAFIPNQGARFRIHHKTLGDWLAGEKDGLPTAGEYAVSIARGHEQLAKWCWAQYERQPRSCCDYCLRHLATHLAATARTTDLQAVLFDLEWIRIKVEKNGVSALVADSALLGTEASRRLAVCISAAAAADSELSLSLAAQLLIRLSTIDCPELAGLRSQARQKVANPGFASLFATMTTTGFLATLEKSPSELTSLILSEDRRLIHGASAGGAQHSWDANTGKSVDWHNPVTWSSNPVREIPPSQRRRFEYAVGNLEAAAMVANADGSRLVAVWRDGLLAAYDAARPDQARVAHGYHAAPTLVRFLDDDKFATHWQIHGAGRTLGETKIWDFTTLGALPGWARHLDWVRAIAIFPDGERAATVSIDRSLHLWDLRNGEVLHAAGVTTNSVGAVAVSPDGLDILTGDRTHTLELWDSTATHVRAWLPMYLEEDSGSTSEEARACYCINAVAFTNDASTAIIGADGIYEIDIADVKSRLPSIPEAQFDMSLEGRQTGVAIPFEDRFPEIYALAVAPDESVVVAGGGGFLGQESPDRLLRVWDRKTRKVVGALVGHQGGVTGVAVVSCDGVLCAVSSSQDGSVISWNLAERKPIHVMQGHIGTVRCVAVTRDGDYIVSGGNDRTLRLWDMRSGRELARLTGDFGFSACAFSADDRLVAGDMSGAVHFFEVICRAAIP